VSEKSGRLTVVRSGLPLPQPDADELVIGFDDFAGRVKSGRLLSHIARHRESRMLVHRLETAGRPLPLSLVLRLLTHGRLWVEDTHGRRQAITLGRLARWLGQVAVEPLKVPALLRRIAATVSALEREARSPRPLSLDLRKPPLYVRTDLSFGIRAGGSVGHIAGVVNNLEHFAPPPLLLTTDDVPTVKPEIEAHVIEPSLQFWNFKELPMFVLNDVCRRAADRLLAGRELSFVYQRYSTNNYSGIEIARTRRVPFVLEYNGSEVWVGRHWGQRLKYEALAERIERLNLVCADLVVVVSRPLADEVARAGVDPAKILTNPNGVETSRYRPDIDGCKVLARYGWNRREVVVGFIGTFGPWHGAEVLARAFASLRSTDPDLMPAVRLLMMGDGARLPAARRIVDDSGASDATVFTGLIPQDQGAEHLAACDILVAPHVANADGTPFFGSPTKLFEYMAMGRGIVASNLDQIGEVLEHGRTGWLVEPGDVRALAAGIRHLILNPDVRAALGAEARRRAVDCHTWREHTRRTVERLRQLVPGS
jgi:glycosyltransferase involved in cell wall biosynthesis